jgi:acyl-CoA thioesterase-1
MKKNFNASKLALFLMTFVFFGCKEQLFDAPIEAAPTTSVVTPVPAETTPVLNTKWWTDVSEVPLPVSDGKPVDASFKKGNTNPTIVVLGSATAEGVGASAKSKSWVELMKAKLKADKKVVTVVNLGTKKFTTYHIMPNKTKVADRPLPRTGQNITKALEKKPFLVIIHLTTGDIHNGYTDEEILKNYATLRQMLIAANVNYLFTGTQPRNFSFANRNRLAKFNDKLKAFDPDHFVDVLKKLSLQDYKMKPLYAFTDGRNLTDPGHAVINGYIFNAPLFKQLLGYK